MRPLHNVLRRHAELVDGFAGAGVVGGHVVPAHASQAVALRQAEQATQQMRTAVDPGLHVDPTNQRGMVGEQHPADKRVVVG
ncbi:hypothetical protein D3C77_723550 [compost metagenome]